jgi:hypothetical protein
VYGTPTHIKLSLHEDQHQLLLQNRVANENKQSQISTKHDYNPVSTKGLPALKNCSILTLGLAYL